MTKTTLIERMTKGGAAKTWIKEVEAKDREIFDLEQIRVQYLSVINLLAFEKEQMEAENEVLREYADHKGYCRARLRQLGDACVCGYTDSLNKLECECDG